MERALKGLVRLIRYRFLLVAGLLPYCLGASVAFYYQRIFDLTLFSIGFIGLLFVLVGVEAFNEYFDWIIGTDRVFQLNPEPVTKRAFYTGIAAFSLALVVAVFLTKELGVAIIVLAILGFLAALFYLAPPVKLAYRGLGELTIALSYGPLMMLGSYYVQSRRIDIQPVFVSIIPALLLFAIAILNEIPDYYQDRLIGKKNICVRMGRRKVMRFYGVVLVAFYIVLITGLLSGEFPPFAWMVLTSLPISFVSYITAIRDHENPRRFILAIRYLLIQYVITLGIFIIGYTFYESLFRLLCKTLPFTFFRSIANPFCITFLN